MTADRHVAWYGELMALQAAFQHDDMGGISEENAENSDRETTLTHMISQTPPKTPAEAASALRFWVAMIRADDGSKWTDELDLLAMSNVADFLESLPADTSAEPSLTVARFRDLELRVRRAEGDLKGLYEKESRPA